MGIKSIRKGGCIPYAGQSAAHNPIIEKQEKRGSSPRDWITNINVFNDRMKVHRNCEKQLTAADHTNKTQYHRDGIFSAST